MLKDISIIDVSGARAAATPITGRSFRILQWLLGANCHTHENGCRIVALASRSRPLVHWE
jgi:hypothetical protein